MKRALAACALAACACAPLDRRTIAAELPPDIELLAVAVEVDDRVEATGLALREADRFDHVLDGVPAGARVHVIGYRRATLTRYAAPSEVTLRERALRSAGPLDPRLPPPDLHLEGLAVGDPIQATPSARALPLTADWLACPLLPTATSAVDLSCFGFWCDARIAQEGCAVHIDAPGCTAEGPLSATLDRVGDATFAPHADFADCRGQPLGDGARCTGPGGAQCTFRVAPPITRPALEVHTIPVVDPLPAPIDVRESGGYLLGAVANGDRIFTVSAEGRYFIRGNCDARGMSLHIIDPRARAVTATVRISACVLRMTADPIGPGVLVLLGGARLSVARLDADGQRVAELDLGPTPPLPNAADLAASARSESAAVLLRTDRNGPNGSARVYLTDLALTSSRTAAREFAPSTEVIEFAPDGHLLVPDGSNTLWRIDPRTGAAQSGPAIDDCTQSAARELVVDGAYGVFSVRNSQFSLAWMELDIGEASCRRAVFPYWAAHPFGVARAPWSPERWIVALDDDQEPGPRPTLLGVVDDATWRFQPEAVSVGNGPVLDLVPDARGHLWGAASWAGALIDVSSAE